MSSIKNIYAGKEDHRGRFTWVDKYPEEIEEAAENEETARHALVLRYKKCFDSRKKLEIHSIIAQSPWLKRALREHILKDYSGITCGLERLIFEAPFEPFVHRWEDLLKCMKLVSQQEQKLSDKMREHITLLHDVLKGELKDTIRALEDYVTHDVITYEHLWTIFQPGAIILSRHSGALSAYEFQSGSCVQTGGAQAYQLTCQCIDWDGQSFGRLTE